MSKPFFAAFDIGAGRGTKMGLFTTELIQVTGDMLPLDKYGEDFDDFTGALLVKLDEMVRKADFSWDDLRGIGISTAGIIGRDGSFLLFQNRSRFNGCNLKKRLEEELDRPAAIANDADAGGLAEWSAMKTELLYWVFGGGWGGSWISDEGKIRFPSHGWNGQDSALHYTNEPGYAIPLEKSRLRLLFKEVNASFDKFERELSEREHLPESLILGPEGNPDTLRAEVILSGTGRYRLFHALGGEEISDPATAGGRIDKLSRQRVESAINTDRLFGKILAEASGVMLKAAYADGMRKGLPICLGGKPSYALPFFGPSCQRLLGKMGYMNYLRPSILDERGANANLVGAAVLARQCSLTA